jgi:hypothetical protein
MPLKQNWFKGKIPSEVILYGDGWGKDQTPGIVSVEEIEPAEIKKEYQEGKFKLDLEAWQNAEKANRMISYHCSSPERIGKIVGRTQTFTTAKDAIEYGFKLGGECAYTGPGLRYAIVESIGSLAGTKTAARIEAGVISARDRG